MSAPAPPYGCIAPPPGPLRNGVGVVSVALGLLVAFGLVAYAAWLGIAAVVTTGSARHVASSMAPRVSLPHNPAVITGTPPAAALPTPSGSTLAFDQVWTLSDGNTVVAGTPTVGTSARTGERVIQLPVTLINNGDRDWNPVSTTFVGTLNHATVPESAEGDWMYRSPIVARTSVTLNRVFVAGPGQFAVTVKTPHGVALFTGRV